jgi:SUN domain-containing protein 1/2
MKGAKTAPPETILQSNTNPGACWSMNGTSGKITLRLAYPVQVSSISLEHVSHLLVPEGNTKSAPKKVRVIGYPTCDHGSTECPMGFDVNDPVEIAQVKYDWEGATIQTFEAGMTAVTSPENHDIDGAILAEEDEEEEEDDDLPPGSCSIKAPSCGAPPQIGDVAAITVEILENWGNPDYTCLYRFRIHGEAA